MAQTALLPSLILPHMKHSMQLCPQPEQGKHHGARFQLHFGYKRPALRLQAPSGLLASSYHIGCFLDLGRQLQRFVSRGELLPQCFGFSVSHLCPLKEAEGEGGE